MIETTADLVGCPDKRVWQCRHERCPKRTWTRHRRPHPRTAGAAARPGGGPDRHRAADLAGRPAARRKQLTTAALDPFRGYATALADQLPAATRVLDPFHVCKLALDALDEIRRRVQQDTLGRRHRDDPLYRARRLQRRRADRLTDRAWARLTARLTPGDPNGEVAAAWALAPDVMAAYAANDVTTGRAAAEQAIAAAGPRDPQRHPAGGGHARTAPRDGAPALADATSDLGPRPRPRAESGGRGTGHAASRSRHRCNTSCGYMSTPGVTRSPWPLPRRRRV
jgi:hypothetical protein